MRQNNSLGRGLASLIPVKTGTLIPTATLAGEKEEKTLEIPTGLVQVNPMQPRQSFDHGLEEDLVNSIKEHGIIQPLIVSKTNQGDYQLIAGERRLRAAKIIGLENVPVIIRNVSQQQKLEVALTENIQRQDLNAVEEAQAYRRLMDEFNLTQEMLSKRVGKNRASIANILRLLELPDEIQKALIDRKLTVGHAKVLMSLKDPKDQLVAYRKILASGLNVQDATFAVKKLRPGKNNDSYDFETREKEELLRKALSTKVKIEKRGKRGKIIIEFYSPEELNSLIAKLANN